MTRVFYICAMIMCWVLLTCNNDLSREGFIQKNIAGKNVSIFVPHDFKEVNPISESCTELDKICNYKLIDKSDSNISININFFLVNDMNLSIDQSFLNNQRQKNLQENSKLEFRTNEITKIDGQEFGVIEYEFEINETKIYTLDAYSYMHPYLINIIYYYKGTPNEKMEVNFNRSLYSLDI